MRFLLLAFMAQPLHQQGQPQGSFSNSTAAALHRRQASGTGGFCHDDDAAAASPPPLLPSSESSESRLLSLAPVPDSMAVLCYSAIKEQTLAIKKQS
jgi:hypothetical protein